jgi:hypothetical protein
MTRSRKTSAWLAALALLAAANAAKAQGIPVQPPSPPFTSCDACASGHSVPGHQHKPGPIKRAAHHVGFTVKDKLIGYPEYFHVPPLGYNLRQNLAAQAANANQHEFTLYRSDFWANSTELTPTAEYKLARMAASLDCWPGLVLIEDVPDRPGLADQRKAAVLNVWSNASRFPLDASRLVVGRSPYYGLRGDDAARTPLTLDTGYYPIMLYRTSEAQRLYPFTPRQSADTGFGVGTR